jgi:hypothetical protein
VQGREAAPDPNRVTLYAGRCEGGPHHGRPLYHGLPVFRLVRHKASGKYISWAGPVTAEIEIEHYRHKDGRWVWEGE